MKKVIQQLIEQISKDKNLVNAILADEVLSYKIQGKPALELSVEDGQAGTRRSVQSYP